MSQNRQTLLKYSAITAIVTVMTANVTANATIVNPGLKTPIGKAVNKSTPLSALSVKSKNPVLDWRTPSQTLTFDMPDTDWTSSLSVILSVDPVGRVNSKAPIYVRFNRETPVKINTKGRGFDARINLDVETIKEKNNKLEIYYGEPQSAECLLPQHGSWMINMDGSSLKMQTRAKSQNYNIDDFKAQLTNPITTPKLIGLVATGTRSAQHQARLAQAIGLRMETLPKFTTAKGYGDIDFIVGRRSDIKSSVRNTEILKGTGSKLIVDNGRPMRVIITGDTDAAVDRAVNAFATFELPFSTSESVHAGHIAMQPRLRTNSAVVIRTRNKLSDIGDINFAPNWNPSEQSIEFDLEDPLATEGEILLRLNSPQILTKTDSHLSVSLNGQSLGQTSLDKKRKSVSFVIPSGVMRGQNNTLRVQPNIQTQSIEGCAQTTYTDNSLSLGMGSILKLTKNGETPLSDMSRLTATGAPFSDMGGKDTLLVLPRKASDYNDALGLLAKFAQISGGSWTHATVTRDSKAVTSLAKGKNVLFIAPTADIPSTIKRTAPKTVKSALNGRAFRGENLIALAPQQYANSDGLSVVQSAARKAQSRNFIQSGGLAALYTSPYDAKKIVGVITSTPGQSFRQSLKTLQKPTHWNALEGSVARWNNATILMTELSSPLPNFVRETPNKHILDMARSRFSDLEFSVLEFTKFKLPEFDLPEFSLPNIDLSSVNMPDFKRPNFNMQALKSKFSFTEKSTSANTFSAEASPRDVTTPTQASSFLDAALVNNTATAPIIQKTADLQLRGLSQVTASDYARRSSYSAVKMEKVSSVTARLSPVSTYWKNKLSTSPLVTYAPETSWTRQKLSASALFVILAVGGLLIALGLSDGKHSPRKPTKNRVRVQGYNKS